MKTLTEKQVHCIQEMIDNKLCDLRDLSDPIYEPSEDAVKIINEEIKMLLSIDHTLNT